MVTYYRPVPDFIPVSQDWGSNPTQDLPSDHWLIRTFGNYQPRGHSGRDYSAAEGTDVYAVTDGTVLWADWATKLPGDDSHWGYVSRWYISKSFAGIVTVIDHGDFLGVYAHLSDNDIAPLGTRVKGGQLIAKTGNTGGSTGPHLHWEAIGKPFNFANGMYGRVSPDLYLANVTTLTPGFTGATTSDETPTLTDPMEEIMAWYKDRAEFERAISVAVLDKTFETADKSKKTSLANETKWNAQNVARLDRKLDAIVTACDVILDRPDFNLEPEAAYAAIGRATVAALKGEQA